MKTRIILFFLLGCSLALSQAGKTAADPWAGTYKLDIAKSKLQPPAPREEIVTVDAATKTSVKYSIANTDAEGKAHTITYDGKPGTPATAMMDGQEGAKITYHWVSARHFTGEEHAPDGSTTTSKVDLSKDHKTITVYAHSKSARGVSDQTFIYVRQ